MKLNWNKQQKDIYQQYARLGERIAKQRNTLEGFDRKAWFQISAEGIWKLAVPKQYGGAGQSWWEFVAAMEGLSSTIGELGFLLSMIAHIGGIRVLLNYGSSEQLKKFLPHLLNGKVCSTAITEITGGSDVARIKLSAKKIQEQYILNGRKAHITNAPIADFAVIVGRIPELGNKKDITLFLIDTHQTGITKGAAEIMFGNNSSPTGDLILKDVKVEQNNILSKAGKGLKILYNMISLDRLLYAIVAAGLSEGLLQKAMDYSMKRHAFNKAITEFQYVQGKLIDIKLNIEKSRWIAYSALQKLIDNAADASMMCSMAKLIGTEGLCQTAQHLMVLHGHDGYMEGDITKLIRDALGTRIAGGTSDIQRVNIFNQMSALYKQQMQLEEVA